MFINKSCLTEKKFLTLESKDLGHGAGPVWLQDCDSIHDFILIERKFINNPSISAVSKVILTYILGLPKDNNIIGEDIERDLNIGRSVRLRCFKELSELGYMKLIAKKDKNNSYVGNFWHASFEPIFKK